MKRALFTFFTLAMLFAATAPQVLALEMRVDHRGVVTFYNDGVLGEKSENSGRVKATVQPVRTINAEEKREIRIKSDEGKTEINIKEKREKAETKSKRYEESETVEAPRLRAEFPAELKTEESETKTEQIEKVRAERQERKEDMVELRTQFKDKKQTLQLESKSVKATIQNGAEFTLDPETNEVTLTTPSGNIHALNHLPDQAIERMKAAGVFDSSIADGEVELEVETTEDGDVLYKAEAQEEKKVFGLFPRKIRKTVRVDDATGEVTETAVEQKTVIGKFLDSLAF
jgi:hypothetical protein